MSALSWLFGVPAWLLAVGLVVVAGFALVPSVSKWLWIGALALVAAWGLAGYGQARIEAGRVKARNAQLQQAAQALDASATALRTAQREIQIRDAQLAHIRAEGERRTANAQQARKEAAPRIQQHRQRAADTLAHQPQADGELERAQAIGDRWLEGRGQ